MRRPGESTLSFLERTSARVAQDFIDKMGPRLDEKLHGAIQSLAYSPSLRSVMKDLSGLKALAIETDPNLLKNKRKYGVVKTRPQRPELRGIPDSERPEDPTGSSGKKLERAVIIDGTLSENRTKCTLPHELRHVSQRTQGALKLLTSLSPRDRLLLNKILEADAVAFSVQVAWELHMTGDSSVLGGMLSQKDRSFNGFRPYVEIYHDAAMEDILSVVDGSAMAKVMSKRLNDKSFSSSYEKVELKRLTEAYARIEADGSERPDFDTRIATKFEGGILDYRLFRQLGKISPSKYTEGLLEICDVTNPQFPRQATLSELEAAFRKLEAAIPTLKVEASAWPPIPKPDQALKTGSTTPQAPPVTAVPSAHTTKPIR